MKKLILMIALVFTFSVSLNETLAFDEVSNAVEVLGVVEGGEYTEDIQISITGGEAFIDGEPYNSNDVYNIIGHHVLTVEELGEVVETINFTIHPRTTLTNGDAFLDSYTIYIENVGSFFLGSKSIETGHQVTEVGNYEVTVRGSNEYEQVILFEINNSTLEYLTANVFYGTLEIDIEPYVSMYYENKKVTENPVFEEMGHYSVKVLGKNGYYKTYNFTIGLSTSTIVDGGVYNNSVYLDGGNAVEFKIANKVKTPKYGGFYYDTVGVHKITFVGNNDYEVDYYITITEGDIGLYDGKVYDGVFQLHFSGFKVSLNGKNYTSNFKKTGGGYYTVVISNGTAYENTFEIFIDEPIPFEDGAQLDESMTLDQNFDKIFVNGVEVEDYHFKSSGEYRVIFEGEGGFIEGRTIQYTNHHETVSEYVTLGAVGLGGFTILMYGFLGWRKFK